MKASDALLNQFMNQCCSQSREFKEAVTILPENSQKAQEFIRMHV